MGTQTVRKRDPEPQELTNLRLGIYNKLYPGLNSFDYTNATNQAQNITNKAFQQADSLLSQLPDTFNQSDSLLNQMTGFVTTGRIPTAMAENMNASVNNALKSSMGDMLNNLAARGVLNSSVTTSAINNLGNNAANAYSQNYLNAYNSVLSGYGSALQGSQNNTSSLLSGLNLIGQIPTQAYTAAYAPLAPVTSFWKDWQSSYDNREDYDTVVTPKSSKCITGDTLVTLSNGQTIPVSELQNDNEIAVWDFNNGCVACAPLMAFVKQTLNDAIDIIRVQFEDGSNVGVIIEHLFFDMTLGKFVAINSDSQEFIGHEFAKVNDDGNVIPVKVTEIFIDGKTTEAYGPQAEGYWNYLAGGVISGNDGQLGICNRFDFDVEKMRYVPDKKEADLLKYGTLDYDALKEIMSEEFFNRNHLEELSVAIGKGLITLEYLQEYAGKFTDFYFDKTRKGKD